MSGLLIPITSKYSISSPVMQGWITDETTLIRKLASSSEAKKTTLTGPLVVLLALFLVVLLTRLLVVLLSLLVILLSRLVIFLFRDVNLFAITTFFLALVLIVLLSFVVLLTRTLLIGFRSAFICWLLRIFCRIVSGRGSMVRL